MLFLVLFVIALGGIWFGLRLSRRQTSTYTQIDLEESGNILAVICGVLAIFLLLVMVIDTACVYSNQVSAQAQVDKLGRTTTIKQKRATELIAQVKEVLVNQYPQYEQATIKQVVNGDPRLILLKFPELQASKTLIKYTNDLVALRSAVYDQRIQRERIVAQMQARKNNGLVHLSFLLPKAAAGKS